MHRIAFILIAFLLSTPRAYAFFDTPLITPAAPRAGETVSVSIRGAMRSSNVRGIHKSHGKGMQFEFLNMVTIGMT
jgi:hypothetical protein